MGTITLGPTNILMDKSKANMSWMYATSEIFKLNMKSTMNYGDSLFSQLRKGFLTHMFQSAKIVVLLLATQGGEKSTWSTSNSITGKKRSSFLKYSAISLLFSDYDQSDIITSICSAHKHIHRWIYTANCFVLLRNDTPSFSLQCQTLKSSLLLELSTQGVRQLPRLQICLSQHCNG